MRTALVLAVLSAALTVSADSGKVVPSPMAAAGLGRYRVTLAPQFADEQEATIQQLLAICRCRQELYAEAGREVLMVNASAAAARLLSSNPRVELVEEVPFAYAAEHPQTESAWPEVVAADETDGAGSEGEPGDLERGEIAASAAPLVPVSDTVDADWDSGLYEYDGAGNIEGIGAKRCTYDAFGRLTYADAAAGKYETYTYDRFGNQTSRKKETNATASFDVDPSTNRMTITQGAKYDRAGRMIESPGGKFVYDAVDMIKETEIDGRKSVHLYSASDERIASIAVDAWNVTQGSEWTIRDLSGKVLRRFKKTAGAAPVWSWDQDYIYRDGQLLASESSSRSRRHYYHSDHLGTPRIITDDHGMKVSTHDYYAFGDEITTPGPERMKFTGHERDDRTLDYMHARYYNPVWGRFLSIDRVLGTPSSPQSWNRYSYALNNPLRLVDPDGNEPRDAVLHVQVNVVYDNSASQERFFGTSLRQDVEAGIMDARDKFATAGIAIDVRRFDGEMSGGSVPGSSMVQLTGSVTTDGGKVAWPTFVASQQGSHTVFVSQNVRLKGGTPGATDVNKGFTIITQNGNAGTFSHEVAHALGNVVGSRPGPLGVNNAAADARWGFQKAFFRMFRRFTDSFQETLRDGAERVAQ